MTPDTSPENISRALREAAAAICVLGNHMKRHGAGDSEAYPFRDQVDELKIIANHLHLSQPPGPPHPQEQSDNTNAHVDAGDFAFITPQGAVPAQSARSKWWNDRVEIVWEKCARANCRRRSAQSYITRKAVSDALRAAFPELAP